MRRRRITLAQLERKNACYASRHRFEDTFGKSVEVTLERAEQYAHDFNFEWAGWHLLPNGVWYPVIKRLDEEYYESRQALDEDYNDATSAAVERYRKHMDYHMYRDEINPLTDAHMQAIEPLRLAYEQRVARAFVELYLNG